MADERLMIAVDRRCSQFDSHRDLSCKQMNGNVQRTASDRDGTGSQGHGSPGHRVSDFGRVGSGHGSEILTRLHPWHPHAPKQHSDVSDLRNGANKITR